MSSKAPRSQRLKIAIIGRRNVGKSSLINAITNQEIAIVSDTPGTTTDPVGKHYELLPVGPVTFYDTAGLDDTGQVGEKRTDATKKIIYRSDIAVIVTDESGLTDYEKNIISKIESIKIPYILVFNKNDLKNISKKDRKYCDENNIDFISVSSKKNENIKELKESIISMVPEYFKKESVIIGDLIRGGDFVVLVVPIDLAAPKGRLILPQVQVIREILDHDAVAVTVKEREIEQVFRKLKKDPKLVITDSQVVLKVSGDVPETVPFTTFSTVFARYKGDLDVLVEGAKEVDNLKTGDRVLIAEACSHHIQSDDIGRVKIPRWLMQYTGKKLDINVVSGYDFPDNLEEYKLVIHCGACMLTGLEMKRRIKMCQRRGVPVSNYGVIISKVHGVLERVIKPFYK